MEGVGEERGESGEGKGEGEGGDEMDMAYGLNVYL